MNKPSQALREQWPWLSAVLTWFGSFHWMQKLLLLALSACALAGAVLWVNYKCCYWPFKYDPLPEPWHPVKKTLGQRMAWASAHVSSALRSHIPDRNPDAARLTALAERSFLMRLDMVYTFVGRIYTDQFYDPATSYARCLFSRTNRIDTAAPKTFWTNTPDYVVLYTTNGPVLPYILYDRPQGIWCFGSYYFRLKGPTNLNEALSPGFAGMWEWPEPTVRFGL